VFLRPRTSFWALLGRIIKNRTNNTTGGFLKFPKILKLNFGVSESKFNFFDIFERFRQPRTLRFLCIFRGVFGLFALIELKIGLGLKMPNLGIFIETEEISKTSDNLA
jgi:hypothetical protein